MGNVKTLYKKGQIVELDIQQYAFGGKGISKLDTTNGKLIFFVINAIPGQKVKAKIIKLKKNYAECRVVEVLQNSKDEKEVPFQLISGAPFIKLPIELQKSYKLASTAETFKKIGRIDEFEDIFDAYIDSPLVYHYRNKMEYAFSAIGYDVEQQKEFDGFALGFKKSGTWWMVENLNKDSGMFDKELEDNLVTIRKYFESTGLPAWHYPQKKGFYRHLIVRKSFSQNQLLFKLVTSDEALNQFDKKKFVDFLTQLMGDRVAGIIHTINDDVGDNAHNRTGKNELLYGHSVIEEKLLGLSFEMSMESFFQTNPASAELLYQKAIDYLTLNNTFQHDEIILDLFCGTGTITQLVALKTNLHVIGVDIVEEAIKNARINAQKNNLTNVQFFAMDVKHFLNKHPQYRNKINTIMLDPPRAGIAPKSLIKIINLNAKRIVYISCNPATQARDVSILVQNHYIPVKLSLVDQFPHTSHIESIILFEKK